MNPANDEQQHPWATTFVPPAPRICVDTMGEGELVIFLHGIGGNRSNWHGQLPAFGQHFCAATWDARGYGGSDDYDGPLDFEDFRRDLARVLDHFGRPKAHIVGLSLGGRVAASFFAAYPHRVASLVLCDTHLGFQHYSDSDRARFLALRQQPLVDERKEPADIAPEIARKLIGNRAHKKAFEALVRSMSALRKDSYLKAIDASVNMDQTDLFRGISVPTLVVVGELDRVTPPALAEDIASRIAGARLEVISNAGHLPNIEQPDIFNRVVLNFLEEIGRHPS